MKPAFFLTEIAILLLLSVGSSCDETFELNAPYEDIYVVYGVLDPSADSQFVRVSLGFQPQKDAFIVAREYDGAIPDLHVRLIGNGQSLVGAFVGNLPKITPGDFADTTGAYLFPTSGDSQLVSGELYRLEIRKADDPDFLLTARSRIPNEPRIISPTRYAFSGEYCLPIVDVEDTVSVLIRKNDSPVNLSEYFEIRWLLRYEYAGQTWELSTSPSPIFNRNVRCSMAGVGNLCYSTGNGTVLREWQSRISVQANRLPVQVRCSQIPIELTRNAEIQVTALDSALSRYILANDQTQVNFNTIRQEYTNIRGSARAVGVFGSIAYDNEPFLLSACAEKILGLTDDPAICD